MPVASASALASAGATGLIGDSLMLLAPKGPRASLVWAKWISRARHVGEGRDAVVAERRVDDPAFRVEDHLLAEGPAQPLGDRRLPPARAVRRIDDRPGIDGLDAVQDADLARDAMDGDPKALHVERDGARRRRRPSAWPAGVAPLAGPRGTGRPGSVPAADNGVFLQPALFRCGAPRPGGEGQDAVAQDRRRPRRPPSPPHWCRHAERAGVVAGAVGVGGGSAWARASEVPSTVATICCRTVAEPLPNSGEPMAR